MSSRSSSAIWILLAASIAAHAVFPFLPFLWGWGLNLNRFLGPVAGWGLWGFAALSLVPAVAKRVQLASIGDTLTRSKAAPAIVGFGLALLAWSMPDRTWFVGDFLMRQGNVESNFLASNYWGALPLDSFLHLVLLRPVGFGSPESANAALRLLGAAEAGVLGVLAVLFARALELRGTAAVVAGAIVVFGGYLTMFTGLGKPASEMCLLVLGLGIAGVRVVRGRDSLLPLGLLAAVGFILHRSSIALVPVTLWIGWMRFRGQLRATRPFGWRDMLAIALPVVAALWTFPYIVSFAARYDVSHHILTASVRQQGIVQATFSLARLQGLVNLIFAISPLWLLGAGLFAVQMSAHRDRTAAVLLGIAVSFVPLLLLIHPQQGLFRDWDVFAPAGMAVSMLTACSVQRPLTMPDRKWLGLPLILGCLVPSVQWLLLNREPEAGLARVRTYLMEHQAPSDLEEALTWDFLAARYFRLRLWPEAADAGSHAAALAPHRRILLMWALAETMKRDDVAAERVYRELLERNPDDPLAWLGLAGTAALLKHSEDYQRAVEKLRSFESDSVKATEIRRHLDYYPEVWSGTVP
jgi:hypothetical protein